MTDHSDDRFIIKWIDRGVEPQCAPDPKYPKGRDLDLVDRNKPFCVVPLPYPARRCGYYVVGCRRCGYTFMCTTAGRPDDPRSITLSCNPPPKNQVPPQKTELH